MRPMALVALILGGLSLPLGGCSNFTKAESSCGGPDASSVTLDIVRDQITKLASQADNEDQPQISKSSIRATVKQLQLSLEDVRTTKDDPNSTKQFCTGTLKLVAPADVVEQANETRQMAGLNSVEQMADNANVEVNANAFSADINFNVQPTDSGDKIFSEIENGSEAFGFFAELVKDHLLKSAVEDAKAQTDRMNAEKQAAEDSANKEIEAASLEEAKATKDSSEQSINATWKALPAELRDGLLPMQRAWIKRKDATCKLEAAQNSSSEAEMSVAFYNCEARENNSRTEYLQQQGQTAINGGAAEGD